MKWMIASDLHGSAYYCAAMLRRFEQEKAERLLLLGDLLYHGPRNDLPREYDPKAVTGMLNGIRDRLMCVRGNCDCEVDQMVLDFPILADYAVLDLGKKTVYATHGHVYNENNLLPLRGGDILLYGHTHEPLNTVRDGIICLNPGSVSIPKADTAHGYMTYEDGTFTWKTLDGEVYDQLST